YVKRGLPRAQKGRDRSLLKELHLLQAMALDDLGRPGDALAAATKALEYEPKDREARREKGVALFELCRFDQAKAELFRPAAETASPEARPTILLYRRNLSRAAHNDDELRREVRDTLMHEVGHLNGEDDEQLRDRGL